MEYTKEDVGMFLRQGRTALDLTHEDVAEAMDCNATYYGNLERGIHYPSLGLFLRMVSYLHLSVDKFVENKEAVRTDTYQQLLRTLSDCTESELQILLENAETLIRHRADTPEDKSNE